MYGVFVNENGGVPYAHAITQGIKPWETRSRNMLRQIVGERVAIIRTRRGKAPTVLGYATISGAEFWTAAELDERRNLTLIPEGSAYDCKGRGKWCYHMENPVECDPFLLPADAVRHGRSWCEF